MQEIINLFSIDTVELERNDGVWVDNNQLLFRSINSGEMVNNTYNSYVCEATFKLDQQATNLFLNSLETDMHHLPLVLKERFAGAAALDRFKRHCDKHKITYQYSFTTE